MQNEFFQSYMHFAWMLYTAFWVIVAAYSFSLAWFIAFGKGTYTIRMGSSQKTENKAR